MKNQIRSLIFKFAFIKNLHFNYLIKTGVLVKSNSINLDLAEKVILEKVLKKPLIVGLVQDGLGPREGYVYARAYYPKYERFLKNNNIRFKYYDINLSNWQKTAAEFDLIIWHTHSDPATQYLAKNKIYVLDKLMGKICLPGFDEIWGYEDKINSHYLFQHYNFPEISTFISNSKEEALEYIRKTGYPFVSKITTGSSSMGVEIINSEKIAKRLTKKVFSRNGRKTYFPYQRQKNYVYFQEFVKNALYDLRVIVVGDKLFGYYRFPKKGDFKASGSGILEKKGIPKEALELAFKIKEAFKTNFLATDFLFDEKKGSFLIIESSIFIGVDTCEQLVADGVPGVYERTEDGNYIFKEGRFWVQELTLKEVFLKNFCI